MQMQTETKLAEQGVRIEDLMLITADGAVSLNKDSSFLKGMEDEFFCQYPVWKNWSNQINWFK